MCLTVSSDSTGGTCVIPGTQRPQQQGSTDLKVNVTVFSKDHLHFMLLFHQTPTNILKKQNLEVISVSQFAETPKAAPNCPTSVGEHWTGSCGGCSLLSPNRSNPQGCHWRQKEISALDSDIWEKHLRWNH